MDAVAVRRAEGRDPMPGDAAGAGSRVPTGRAARRCSPRATADAAYFATGGSASRRTKRSSETEYSPVAASWRMHVMVG